MAQHESFGGGEFRRYDHTHRSLSHQLGVRTGKLRIEHDTGTLDASIDSSIDGAADKQGEYQ